NHDDIYEQLLELDVKFVIFGIAEDIGVFANLGETGASKAWDVAIKFLLNTQMNDKNNADRVLVLGHFEFTDLQNQIKSLDQNNPTDIKKSRFLVEIIDKEVNYLVTEIVSAGKIPIIIGGGHNNAYGIIKGTSLALKKPINVINFDAHHDFRPMEGRHSGNGFSYAFNEGFLKRYFIFGLDENYVSKSISRLIKRLKNISYFTFEEMMIREERNYFELMYKAKKFLRKSHFGIELDVDAIENVPSSAISPSGFTVTQARQFVHYFGFKESVKYLHICEAAPNSRHEKQVGKLISYLITDFIRAVKN
ncbi:MAG: arginase family protein, partial [Bacteroidota bacterium]